MQSSDRVRWFKGVMRTGPGRRCRSLIAAAATSVMALWAHPALAHTVYVVSETNLLLRFDTSSPGTTTNIGAITGLLGGEQILAMDMNARDGRLYGVSDLHLYKINQATGVATVVSNTAFPAPLAGAVSVDFDPATGLLRVITSTGQNLTVTPDTAEVTDASPIAAGASIVGAGYLAPIGSVSPSTLKAIDATGDRLLTLASPDTGAWTVTGPLGFDTGDSASLDYSIDGRGWAVMAAAADIQSTFFSIAENGTATVVGMLPVRARAMAVISRAWRLYGLTDSNTIVTFHSNLAGQPIAQSGLTEVPILYLSSGEKVLAIDTFWQTGEVFGITSLGRLIIVDPTTGAVVFKGTLNETLDGIPVGFDIDPINVRARVTTTTGQNLSVLLSNATVIPETDLSSTGVVGLAYTPITGGLTTLYGIDASTDQVVTFANPSNGVSTPVLPLGFDVENNPFVAMDFAEDGTLFASIGSNAATSSTLYIISPTAGTVLNYQAIGAPKFRGLAVAPAGLVRFNQAQYKVFESMGNVLVTIERNYGSDGPAYVTLTLSNGTATSPGDYPPLSTVVEFLDGEVAKTIKVLINDDATVETDETIEATLQNPQLGVRVDVPNPVNIVIKNDDAVLGTARPTVTITSPTTDDSVMWTSLFATLAGTATDDTTVSSVTWLNDRGGSGTATIVGGPAASVSWEAQSLKLVQGTNTITVTATDNLGNVSTDSVVFVVSELSYYLAEGATGTFFDLDLALANPTGSPVIVKAKFLKPLGQGVAEQLITLAPNSRRTVRVDEVPGLENAEVSTIVTAPVSVPIVVERTMTWDSTGYGAHTDKAAAGASQKWYFAEGSQGFFFTYLLLANPQTTANSATVRYLREGNTPVTRVYPLAQLERRTVDIGADEDLVNTSFGIEVTFDQPGIAERAMYFGLNPLWLGGHESMGETQPSLTWFLAEGATGPFFETFVLIANPSATDATVQVEFLPAIGSPVSKSYTVEAGTRETINIEAEDVSLANAAVATSLTSNVPIVVERAQYWPDPAPSWYEAHNSFGVTSPGLRWGLAEGRVGGPNNYETYILLANPSDVSTGAFVDFLREDGTIITKEFGVGPKSRTNVQVSLDVPELVNESFGVYVRAVHPIVVERAMYSNAGGQVWQAGTNATATRLPSPNP